MAANHRTPAALFLLALVLRLVYLLEISDTPYFHTLVLDAQEYEYLARSLAAGNWQLAAKGIYVHGPLYPLLWTLLKLGGGGNLAMRLLQTVLSALSW